MFPCVLALMLTGVVVFAYLWGKTAAKEKMQRVLNEVYMEAYFSQTQTYNEGCLAGFKKCQMTHQKRGGDGKFLRKKSI